MGPLGIALLIVSPFLIGLALVIPLSSDKKKDCNNGSCHRKE